MSTQSPPDVDRAGQTMAPPEKTGLWEDFVDIFVAPASVFARRERGSIAVPIVVVALLMGIISLVSMDTLGTLMEAESRRAMAADPRIAQLPPEQLAAMMRWQTIIAAAGAFIYVPIVILVIGLLLWFAGKAVDASQTLHAALVVAAYSYVPRVIESVLVAVQGRILDPALLDGMYRVRLSPARFYDPDTASPLLLAVLGRFDLFVIWVTMLLAVGLAVTGRVSRGRAAIAALIVWVVGALPAVFGAMRQAQG
jgi:hypothetical protein